MLLTYIFDGIRTDTAFNQRFPKFHRPSHLVTVLITWHSITSALLLVNTFITSFLEHTLRNNQVGEARKSCIQAIYSSYNLSYLWLAKTHNQGHKIYYRLFKIENHQFGFR